MLYTYDYDDYDDDDDDDDDDDVASLWHSKHYS